jgi:hypothetical protein
MATLTSYDKAAAETCVLLYADGIQQEFQFPPKVTSDDANLEWNSTAGSAYTGEILFPKSIKNRTLKLEWTYLPGFDGWSIADVQIQVRNFRGFIYAGVLEDEASTYAFAIDFKYPGITGDSTQTVAMSDMSVKYSDTMYTSPIVYPTKVDLSCTLKLWYNVAAGKKAAEDAKSAQPDPKNPNPQPKADDDGGLNLKNISYAWY